MLYLKRKVGEEIVINDNIYLSVESISDNHVKLGFKFPEDSKVMRKEIIDNVKQQNKEALADEQDVKNLSKENK